MIELEGPGWRDQYLSRTWNNTLVAVLGLPTLVYVVLVLATSVLSARAAFIGMVLIGGVY